MPVQRRALALAIGVSIALHALLWLGATGVPFFRLSVEVPIELVTMQKHVPAPPSLDPTQPKQDRNSARVVPEPGEGAKPKAKPQPLPIKDVHEIGPASANVTIILRTSLVKNSPYRDGVEQLLALLPDYHTLLDGTSLHLFDDLSALLIATPDPRDVAATFLAARHGDDPRFERITHKSLGADDPRVFRALGPELTVLGPSEVLAKLDEVDGAGLAESRRWIAALRTFDVGNAQAALQLSIADLSQLIRFDGPLPLPHSIRLSMSAEASPAVRLVCDFDREEDALRFVAYWPEVQRRVGELAPLFAGALDQLPAVRHERSVELSGHLPERQVRAALSLAKIFAPVQVAPAESPPAVGPSAAPSVPIDMQ